MSKTKFKLRGEDADGMKNDRGKEIKVNLEEPKNLSTSSLPSLSSSSSPRNILIFFVANFAIFVWCYINYKILQNYINEFTYEQYWYVFRGGPCTQSKERIHEMSKLAIDASRALSNLGSNPVACYGTLLAALRRGDALPWDNNVDLCVLDPICSHDVKIIRHQFLTFGIVIEPYDSWNGVFRFYRNGVKGFVYVFSECTFLDDIRFYGQPDRSLEAFDEESSFIEQTDNSADGYKWLCPDGRLPYLAQLFQGHTKPIPAALFKPPFQSLPFGRRNSTGSSSTIAVPHGDVEITKYFYPYSWWLEVKPVGCE